MTRPKKKDKAKSRQDLLGIIEELLRWGYSDEVGGCRYCGAEQKFLRWEGDFPKYAIEHRPGCTWVLACKAINKKP